MTTTSKTRIPSAQSPEEPPIYVYHNGVAQDILGPGKRLLVWTSGCPFRCPGCIEPKLQELVAGEAWNTDEYRQAIEPTVNILRRITFSGGEPLFQAQAILRLISGFSYRPEIMLFTGYEAQEALNKFPQVLEKVDILVAGPFLEDRTGSFLWRGSSNQEIISPSGRFAASELDAWMQSPSAGIQVHFRNAGFYVYGIPAKGSLEALQSRLHAQQIELNAT
ncbi:MAG: radical SAM protein [Candidatus Cloacimonetes bacterium]|jgi:anaerobic ribonucleoside-triphosphate reductase activating protein|nr:radical SAM protein [Candidatus Cloacimonadota bacterium]MCB5287888.1 radical SAM protein [Candidatus Cloacimonadota bacterium]MCK9184931.1 radical SAM protein [Candidatus Cloacimonadota bacterium]MCK9583984.1 radical SAM protein [Candidatus Cloacimonadota bacterium]MDY0230208.1 4Fe-4S single cluster domain-containing protein [Candidatus Cloacimonadaceae bacterium]